jgi:hypothetical protein
MISGCALLAAVDGEVRSGVVRGAGGLACSSLFSTWRSGWSGSGCPLMTLLFEVSVLGSTGSLSIGSWCSDMMPYQKLRIGRRYIGTQSLVGPTIPTVAGLIA